MTQPRQNLAWTASGAVPTQPGVARDPSYKTNPISGVFSGLKDTYIPTGWPWVSQVRASWDRAVESAFLGKKSPQQALQDEAAQAAKDIAQAKQSLNLK